MALATDIMLQTPASVSPESGDLIATNLMLHAGEYDIEYIVWNHRIWSNTRGDALVSPDQWRMIDNGVSRGSRTADHEDHVHVSFKP
jgi:hypothetical protein